MNYIFESNRIYLEDDAGQLIAEITYPQTQTNVFTIDHTFVDDSLRGQGIARELVKLAVEKIKEQGGQVKATCSYAKHWLEKNPQ